MYGRHFESMYSGSMYGGGFGLFAVWGYVIAKRNGDQIELNPHILAHIFGESLKSIEIIIEKLCSPDEHSRSKTQEGRRLVRLGQFLYQVVNAGEYDKIASEKDRQVYLRQKQRESRRKRRCQQVSTSVNKNIPSDSDANEDAKENSKERGAFAPPSPQDVRQYGESIGYNIDGQKFCDFYKSKGWMIGKNKMKDWEAAVRTWQKRDKESRGETIDEQIDRVMREESERKAQK